MLRRLMMGEATRDAYLRACIEFDAATKALEAAESRLRAAREACERLEAALDMTCLCEGPFPQLDCPEGRRAAALAMALHAGAEEDWPGL
jgi:hypothetical protein